MLYDLDRKLRAAPVLRQLEMTAFAEVFFKPQAKQSKRDHGQYEKWVSPAAERFVQAYTAPGDPTDISEEGEQFKGDLQSFVRLYGFLSQVIRWTDSELEMLYAYGRLLLTKLPYNAGGGRLVLDDEVQLTAYRNEVTHEGSASLAVGETRPVYGVTEVGTGKVRDEKMTPLSAVIEMINEKAGTDWVDEDWLFYQQSTGDMMRDETLVNQARVNSKEQLRNTFEEHVIDAIWQRQDRNEKIAGEFFANDKLRQIVVDALLDEFYLRVHAQ